MNCRILITVLLVVTGYCFAQNQALDRGSILISASGSYSSQGGELYEDLAEQNKNSTTITESFVYFIQDHYFAGQAGSCAGMSQGTWKNTEFSLGPRLGIAMGQPHDIVLPFIACDYRLISVFEMNNKYWGSDLVLGGGLVITLHQHLGILIDVGYHLIRLNHNSWSEAKTGSNLLVTIGFAGMFN